MPSLERFFNPQTRVFSANITSMPGARLYFFATGSTTPKVTYANKEGTIENTNPVIAKPTGYFDPIFLDGLYRVELRSSGNIVQPGWPIDNVGQDTPIVPYAPWSELVTYAEFERVTDPLTGIVYRSLADNNLGNVPASSPSDWEVVIDPVPSSFTSDAAWLSWSDDGGQISLDVDQNALNAEVAAGLVNIPNTLELDTGYLQIGLSSDTKTFFRFDGKISSDNVNYEDIAARKSTRFALSGGFDASQFVVCERVGNTVTITSDGNLTHPSASVRLSTGALPAEYLTSQISDLSFGYARFNYLIQIDITVSGTIRVSYYDYTGAAVSRTSTGGPFSVSYTITSETP